MQLVAFPLICVAPPLLKGGGPLAVVGFYGAVLLQHERMAQPRRVYGEIYKIKASLVKGLLPTVWGDATQWQRGRVPVRRWVAKQLGGILVSRTIFN